MLPGIKALTIVGLLLTGTGLTGAASALPTNGLGTEIAAQAKTKGAVENVRWICPPYRAGAGPR